MGNFFEFAKESNQIEKIYDEVRHCGHAAALEWFTDLKKITVEDLVKFVKDIEPESFLRTQDSHQVYIGGRAAPKALQAMALLDSLLIKINTAVGADPLEAHCLYEYIHPFIDGNGRSGRAIWLWMMIRDRGHAYALNYPFLQWFYYQALSGSSENTTKFFKASNHATLIQVKGLVSEYFKGDQDKIQLWLNNPNYNFGGVSPVTMISNNRGDKVLNFILNAKLEGKWDDGVNSSKLSPML